MKVLKPFPLLASETALESLLDDLEFEVGEAVVFRLRASGTYHHFMGYACELELLGFEPFGPDPLGLTVQESEELAEHVRRADKKRQTELARWQRKKEKASKIPERSKRVSAR